MPGPVTPGIVIYATGSPIVVDLEESLFRAGIAIRAGVRNRPGPSFLSDARRAVGLGELSDEIKAMPFLVPLFTPGNRQLAVLEARSHGFAEAASLIDPSVAAPRSLDHRPGLYVNAVCSLGGGGSFEDFGFVNRGASLGHHLRCAGYVSIGPGAVIAGNVTIGLGAVVGAGAVVLPGITIGANAVVGAGAVVTRDVPSHCQVVGNPARTVKSGIAGYNGITVT